MSAQGDGEPHVLGTEVATFGRFRPKWPSPGFSPRKSLIACVLPWFGLTDGALGAKELKPGFAYTVRARYGPVLASSDDSGVVAMVKPV